MLRRLSSIALRASLPLLAACGGSGPSSDATGDPPTGSDPEPTFGADLTHDFETLSLGPGSEDDTLCQSWTPGHDDTLYVNAVRMTTPGGFHHMNFFFVPEDMYEGPDGTWNCDDRGYSLEVSAVAGGVFFAQSTQANEEVMRFAEGAAIPVPTGYKIIGNLHTLNTRAETLDTRLRFELDTIPREEVSARMTGFIFQYHELDIPPRSRAEFATTCDVAGGHMENLSRPIDFDVYYLLPHYHDLGDLMSLELVGGVRDGEVLHETTSSNGVPVGKSFDPPVSLSGADRIRLTCGFDNPHDKTIGWGIGDDEMCIMFGFSDSENLWAWTSDDATHEVVAQDGSSLSARADCVTVTAPSTTQRL